MIKDCRRFACFRFIILGAILISFLNLSAQKLRTDSSIVFIDNDWGKIKKLAQTTDKIIFIYGCKEGYSPCKMMDKDVFTMARIGQFYNTHFINLKLDLDKGDGVDIAIKYKVQGYPAFLFLSPEGLLIHQGVGYMPADSFLLLGKKVTAPETQIAAFQTAFDQGNRSADLLYRYAFALSSANDTLSFKIGKMYLDKKEIWASNQALAMVGLIARSYGDPYYSYMVEKRYLFVKEFGEGAVDAKLVQIIEDFLFENLDALDLDEAKNIFKESFPSRKAAPLFDRFEINYWDRKGSQDTYIEKTKAFVKKYSNISWSTLNELAWEFYEKVSDPKALKSAIKWSKKSISLNTNRFNTDTLAALYFKTGKQKAALKWAKKSIAMAEEAGANHQETTALLEKINKM